MKRELIIKNPNTKLKIFSKYLSFTLNGATMLMAYKHINNIYINKTVNISLSDLYKLSLKVSVYITDHNGYILASIKDEK